MINASGRISLPAGLDGTGPGAEQRQLLEDEGIIFRDSGAVGIGYFWEPKR